MKGKNEDIIRARFTRYVQTAVKRSKKDYINREKRQKELPMELEIWDEVGEEEIYITACCLDKAGEIPWETEAVRQYLKDCVDNRMWKSLSCLTDFEVEIVFAKVFRQLTFEEISRRMGEGPDKIASAYSYARKKMKKGWKTNGD